MCYTIYTSYTPTPMWPEMDGLETIPTWFKWSVYVGLLGHETNLQVVALMLVTARAMVRTTCGWSSGGLLSGAFYFQIDWFDHKFLYIYIHYVRIYIWISKCIHFTWISLSLSPGRIVNSHTQQPSCKDAHPIFTIHDMGPNMALALS